ncbi:MAG: MgtC/SapB family protein [SAR86 cluster bacterium]|jgi:putative Mg2+ transporter-C (MgtC) family protein|uniref:Protein MgtC n=1 Tax=SAR86 cluster bacterium TaxID=2030880 RepID=A0A972VXA9_9GAMM|nr:MgtC/SapB family protein [SAR86 cluster bacterium]|tara:strand:+ start:133 stop:639 length:507 start_codon:yes stop_codon:yes gene_type:complete
MNIDQIFTVAPFSWSELGAAILCGLIVGLERQLRGKPVGIRTSALIVLGTYLFIALSMHLTSAVTDPSRIIGQVVTGVGFLGAGVMLAKDGIVVGVTSAATIWALAAVGVCIPIVGEMVAIKLSVLIVMILYGVDVLEDYSAIFTRGVHSRFSDWRQKSGARRRNGSE